MDFHPLPPHPIGWWMVDLLVEKGKIMKNKPTPKNLTGRRFGRLKAIERAGSDKRYNKLWLCQCDCGKMSIARGDNLRKGRSKSCGCLQLKFARGIINKTKKRQAAMAEKVQKFMEDKKEEK
jgi:hypothetical protein